MMYNIFQHAVERARATLICLAIGAWLVLPVSAHAQAERAADDSGVIEEIVVTGSRIKRRDFHSPSPISTISRDEILFSGQGTLEELLNQMPQVMPDVGRTSNNPGDGTAGLNLRGLGAGRTLVLLNGRRVAPSGIGSAIDVNNLPQALMERVEVITGGAATVYGSDALAGVINFITRQDYEGFNIDAGVYGAEQGDAESYDLNVAYGHNLADGKGNITIFAGFYERKASFARDRKITEVPFIDDWDAGVLEAGGSTLIPAARVLFPPADLGDGPVSLTFDPDGTPREFLRPDDLFNYQDWTYLQLPLRRYSVGVMANIEITDGLEAYLEATFTRNNAFQNLAPVPAVTFAIINTDNPLLAPETQQVFTDNFLIAPGLAGFFVGRRLTELDARREEHNRDYGRIVAGLRGSLSGQWEFDAWLTYTKAKEEEELFNVASESRFLQGLLVDPATGQCFDPSRGCVGLNIFGEGNLSAEGAAFITIKDIFNRTERTQKLAAVVLTGPLFNTWAGPIDVAVGVEWRSDEGEFEADDILFTDDALGFPSASPVVGSESVYEIYGEAIIPLAEGVTWAQYLALEIGARFSRYENAGESWTYKVGGQWQPIDAVRFRAMHQRSVRAPNVSELFEEQTTQDSSFVDFFNVDPCSASEDPDDRGNREKCISQGLPADQVGIFEATLFYPTRFTFGGNPDLEPEIAETWTVGVILTPERFDNWEVAVDYFEISVEDTIGNINASLICFDPINTKGLFCNNLVRDATGNVSSVEELISNRGNLDTRGVDTQIQFVSDLPAMLAIADGYAQLAVKTVWTHTVSITSQENPVTAKLDCAGRFGLFPCGFFFDNAASTYPKNRVTTNANYQSGPWNVHLTWRWIEGTRNAASLWVDVFGGPPANPAISSISSQNYFDLGVGFAFADHTTLRFGISNLLDNDPPFVADQSFNNNTDTRMYDVFGRSFYLTLSASY